MPEEIHLLRIFYPDNRIETIPGIIDYEKRIIKILESDEDNLKGYKEKGFINMDFVKKVDILRRISFSGNDSENL